MDWFSATVEGERGVSLVERIRRTVDLIGEVQQGVENSCQTLENGGRGELIEAAQHLFGGIGQRFLETNGLVSFATEQSLERFTFNVSSFFLLIGDRRTESKICTGANQRHSS